MKRVFYLLLMVFLVAGWARADEVDEGLPGAPEPVKVGTRAMIRAGAAKGDAVRMIRLMLENRFRIETILRAQELIREAASEDLPPEPLIFKALEGMAKRVNEGRILQAMERVRSRYAEARRYAVDLAQDEDARRRLTAHLAEAMTAGVTPYDLERILHQYEFHSRGMAGGEKAELASETFSTVKELARHGVSSRDAGDLMCEALKQHYRAQEMAQLRRAFRRHSQNTSARVVAKGYVEAVTQGRNVETLDFSPGHGAREGSGAGYGGAGGSSGSGTGGAVLQGGGTAGSGGFGEGGPGKGLGGPRSGGR